MLHGLAVSLQTQYQRTGDVGYIEEGIEHLYDASKLVISGHPDSRHFLNFLAANLLDRFRHHGADKDITDAIKHFRSSISLFPEGHPELTGMLSNFCQLLALDLFLDTAMQNISRSLLLCLDLPWNTHSLVCVVD
jgi:hypothetical protein